MTRILMTGQHKETMQDLIEEFGIRTRQEAAIPASERSTVTSLMRWLPAAMSGVSRCLQAASSYPGGTNVVVHGDTLSTLIGAFCGRRAGARIVHLESGLTSGRMFDPFPEEISRRLVFRWTDTALCPGPDSAGHMKANYHCEVLDTGGNTILDAVRLIGADPGSRDKTSPYLVASLHRFQNLYDSTRLDALVKILEDLSRLMPIFFVLHPATVTKLQSRRLYDRLSSNPRIRLTPRMGYGAFLNLAARSEGVLTDGGSNQEELAALGVPTVVMRDRTERSDGLGRNIVMEHELEGGVVKFITGGGLDSLRFNPLPLDEQGPSQRVAAFLGAT